MTSSSEQDRRRPVRQRPVQTSAGPGPDLSEQPAGHAETGFAEKLDAPPRSELEHVARPAAGRLAWGRFMGCTEKITAVRAAIDAAVGPQAALVMITGEPGVGKTRLADAMARMLRSPLSSRLVTLGRRRQPSLVAVHSDRCVGVSDRSIRLGVRRFLNLKSHHTWLTKWRGIPSAASFKLIRSLARFCLHSISVPLKIGIGQKAGVRWVRNVPFAWIHLSTRRASLIYF